MRDLIGNKIIEGNLLHWISMNARVKVVRISGDSGLSVVGKDKQPTPTMTIELTVGGRVENGKEPQLADFVRVVDPESESILDHLSGSSRH